MSEFTTFTEAAKSWAEQMSRYFAPNEPVTTDEARRACRKAFWGDRFEGKPYVYTFLKRKDGYGWCLDLDTADREVMAEVITQDRRAKMVLPFETETDEDLAKRGLHYEPRMNPAYMEQGVQFAKVKCCPVCGQDTLFAYWYVKEGLARVFQCNCGAHFALSGWY